MKNEKSIFDLLYWIQDQRRALVVATHDGIFHLDETLCLAMLKYLCDAIKLEMIVYRTRDMKLINEADIAIDVGMVYDPDKYRFDHHQRGGAGRRVSSDPKKEGTPFSSVGLFWKHFGVDFCKVVLDLECKVKVQEKQLPEIQNKVDRFLIEGTCALDTGSAKIKSNGLMLQSLASAVSHLNPVGIMHKSGLKAQVDAQKRATEFLKLTLVGFVMRAADSIVGLAEVSQAMSDSRRAGSRILVLSSSTQAWRGIAVRNPHIMLVIQPQPDEKQTWGILAVGRDDCSFQFPDAWRGYGAEVLASLTGVETFTFCHDTGFIATALTQVDAIEIALIALDIWDKSVEAKS